MGNLLPHNSVEAVEKLTPRYPVEPTLYKDTPAGAQIELHRATALGVNALKSPSIAAYVGTEPASNDLVAEVAIQQVAKPEKGKKHTMEVVALHAEPGKERRAVEEIVPSILHVLGADAAIVDPAHTNIAKESLREAGLQANDFGQFVIPAAV